MTKPVIVSSENGVQAAEQAMDLLRQGASALDTAVAAASLVEQDLADHSVGKAGIPNVLGTVELDASVMDGSSLQAGAVAALKSCADATRLARFVMENTPHVLVVGEGAQRLAREADFEFTTLEHEASLDTWRDRFHQTDLEPEKLDPEQLLPVVNRLTSQLSLLPRTEGGQATSLPETGTVNFLVLDSQGRMASTVSTSGLGWKYPGRVGDSPIIGAGNYCHGKYGAAACTGMGELCLRALTARTVVESLKRGQSLCEAGREALLDLQELQRPAGPFVGFIALTPTGQHMGFSERPGKQYAYMTGNMRTACLSSRLTLDTLV